MYTKSVILVMRFRDLQGSFQLKQYSRSYQWLNNFTWVADGGVGGEHASPSFRGRFALAKG